MLAYEQKNVSMGMAVQEERKKRPLRSRNVRKKTSIKPLLVLPIGTNKKIKVRTHDNIPYQKYFVRFLERNKTYKVTDFVNLFKVDIKDPYQKKALHKRLRNLVKNNILIKSGDNYRIRNIERM